MLNDVWVNSICSEEGGEVLMKQFCKLHGNDPIIYGNDTTMLY